MSFIYLILVVKDNSMKDNSVKDKFHYENEWFMTSTEDINATDILDALEPRVERGLFPKNTIFEMIAGIHHKEDGQVGQNDANQASSFYQSVFTKLSKHQKWKEMSYESHLQILSSDDCQEYNQYDLSELSKTELIKLTSELMKREVPTVIIFASCRSYYSPIRDLLISNGTLAVLDIVKDNFNFTGGKIVAFDEDQKNVIKTCREKKVNLFSLKSSLILLRKDVNSLALICRTTYGWKCFTFQESLRNFILYGSFGTGKTLMLVEILKMRIAYFKSLRKTPTVYVVTYGENHKLLSDFQKKYFLDNYDCTFTTMNDLSRGKSYLSWLVQFILSSEITTSVVKSLL